MMRALALATPLLLALLPVAPVLLTGCQAMHVRSCPAVRRGQHNNSFAAVAPGGRWFLSGGWGTRRRLLIFPMPGPTWHGSASLSLEEDLM